MFNANLIFIIGAPRSGTTWLQLMLSQSDLVVTTQETHLFSSYLQSMLTSWETHKSTPRKVGLQNVFNEQEFYAMIKQISDTVFERVFQEKKC